MFDSFEVSGDNQFLSELMMARAATNNAKRTMKTSDGHLLHQLDFPVRWGDMDAMGHVNNVMYFRYFEQVRLDWYLQSGIADLTPDNVTIVIVDNHAEYLKPVVFPMHVDVKMYGHSAGRSSVVTNYILSVDEVVYTRGSAKVVWIDTATQKSCPLPDAVRELVKTE